MSDAAGPDSFLIRVGTAAEVIDLRHAMLRTGLARETAVFSGDEHPDARHVVAVTPQGRIVGCATVHPSTWNDAPAWQLRGMATDPAFRGTGAGRAMLKSMERILLQQTTHALWCNARVPAVGFYQRLGWTVVSEVFEIPTAGPHVRMTKML